LFPNFDAFVLILVLADVYTSGESSEEVAREWLARYAENNQEALTELINFVFKSAGCSVQVSVHDINDPDNVDGRLADMQEEFQAVSQALMANARQDTNISSKISQITLLSRRQRAATHFGQH
jgi:hypothetical protein